jgi:hypothetical protein
MTLIRRQSDNFFSSAENVTVTQRTAPSRLDCSRRGSPVGQKINILGTIILLSSEWTLNFERGILRGICQFEMDLYIEWYPIL